MKNLTIINSKVVNEGFVKEQDILIKDGRIEKIDKLIEPQGEYIDGSGLALLPGVIDDQVHFREPGLTDKGDIHSESRAAVAGGTTTFMDMPNVLPPTLSRDLWNEKNQIAKKNSHANYSFYMGTSNTNIEEIRAIDPLEVCGVKVFMGSSTGNLLVDNPVSLENIFKDSPVLIATHCEETPMIIAKEKEFKKRYGDNIPIESHEFIRSREACLASSKKAVDLAKEFNSKLHILHVSTEDELALLTNDNIENKQISAEVCVPHLFFSSDDYLTKGTRIKCNPSIKNISDKIALRKALKSGLIDFVATDHAPHDIILKGNSYFSCPSGMPSIQHTLLAVLQLVRDGDLSLEDVSKVTSHNVATRFNIKDRGYIREGYWADLVLVDLEKEQVINNKNLEYKCGWSPFEGDKFSSTIIETIINGERAYSEGKVIDNIRGKKIEFTRG